MSEGKTVNKQLYTDILCHLRDAVRMKCSDKWRTNSWFLLEDNAPAYWLVVMNDFLAKNNVTTLEHLPYSPDLPAPDFNLFPQLKSALMGWHICGATDIMKNAAEELKRLAQNWFQECFQHLYSSWQKFVVVLFWRKCSLNDCTVCSSQNWSDSGNISKLRHITRN